MKKVLLSDTLSDGWQDVFDGESDIQVDVNTGLSESELCEIVGDYSALIVRSSTQVTRKVLEAGDNLQVIGRAGVGVDNIDLDAATERGVVVMYAPSGNTISTAELTLAMLLSLSRNIPQATTSLKGGQWDRKSYTGVELAGKTLGIIGVGRVGQQVASYARSFGLKLLGIDPFLSDERARQLDVDLVSYDELFAEADYITLHTVLNDSTRNLIDAGALARCKTGVRIINCARGGLVDEQALLEAIESGKVAGAALDVYDSEPPPEDYPLLKRPEVICTPHLGASTLEAQEKVAIQIAEEVKNALLDRPFQNAVNLPSIDSAHFEEISPYLVLAEKVGSLHAQLMSGHLRRIMCQFQGVIREYATGPLTADVLKGVLSSSTEEPVTQVNARIFADRRGIKIEETKSDHQDYVNLITVDCETSEETTAISATVFGRRDARLVRFDDIEVKAKLEGHMLFLSNKDEPGVVGRLGLILSEANINISDLALGRKEAGSEAIMVFNIDTPAPSDLLERIENEDLVYWVKQVNL